MKKWLQKFLGRWLGRKGVPAPPVQGELTDPNFEPKETKGCRRREHHSRGNRDTRGRY